MDSGTMQFILQFVQRVSDGNETSESNGTGIMTEFPDTEISEHPAFRGFCIFIYSIIIALGILGNTMVCVAIVRNKKLHNSTYIFIGNLSVSDAAVCLICLPFTLAHTLAGKWSFGKIMCYIIRPMQPIAVFLSVLTMTAISIDRYIIVIYPFRKRLSLRLVGMILTLIWVVSISLATPFIVNTRFIYNEFNFDNMTYVKFNQCSERWKSPEHRKVYSTFVFILQYALPLFVISTAYYRVWMELQHQVRPGALSAQKKKQEIARKKKTNKMLVTVVVCFLACWLPFNMLMILGDYHVSIKSDYYWYDLIYHLFHVIAMSSTCINPFIYGGLDELFHKEFVKIMRCVFHSSRGATTTATRDIILAT